MTGFVWVRGTSLKVRVLAVVASIIAALYKKRRVTHFKHFLEEYHCEIPIANTTQFSDSNYRRFFEGGSLDECPCEGRPHAINEGLAREVAQLLKQGHMVNGQRVYLITASRRRVN